ncbi:MAG TPA: type IV secretory system conjugative DNA transfer family protein, partial [Burkholderiaceae bacterium]
ANPAEVARAGLLGAGRGPAPPSIIIGRYRGRFLTLPGQLSVMLSAPTRSGKGVGVVVPNLLNWPDSAVVLDIKGENHAITAGYRAAHGQAVFAFSPFDEDARSHRWNPLTAVRTSPLHRVGDLLTIAQVFFPNDGGSTSSEAFFNDQARNLFLGLGLLLLETPELPRTLGELLRQSSGNGQSLKGHLAGVIDQRQKDADHRHPPLSDECTDALQRLLSNSDNTLTSIVATFNAPLTIFADAIVDAATSADDFRLEDLRRRRMSIYVRIPPNRLANARPLLNLFFSQLVSLNTQQLPEQDASLKLQCLLVNDEFAAMGRVGVISTAAAFLAGYNLRLLSVVQAMSQLDAVYGDKDARTFATNHGLQILYAPREQRDADEYSAMLGHYTERATSRGRSRSFSQHGHTSTSRNDSDQRRALLLPQEFKELGSERLVVIFENCKPILGEKIRYHREKVFAARLRPPPAVPPMNMDLHFARVQQRWRYADDELPAAASFDIEQLAQDFSDLPVPDEHSGAIDIKRCVDGFFSKTVIAAPAAAAGGTIEAVADDLDGAEPEAPAFERAAPALACEPQAPARM